MSLIEDGLRELVRGQLALFLLEIERTDPSNGGEEPDYDQHNKWVVHAVWNALTAGYKAGFRIDPSEPEWPVAYIELPTGQVSWHLPQHDRDFDGHTNADKSMRIKEFVKQVDEGTIYRVESLAEKALNDVTQGETMGNRSLGQVAFEANSAARRGRTYDDKPIPAWDELDGDRAATQAAWDAAAQAVVEHAQVEAAEHLGVRQPAPPMGTGPFSGPSTDPQDVQSGPNR